VREMENSKVYIIKIRRRFKMGYLNLRVCSTLDIAVRYKRKLLEELPKKTRVIIEERFLMNSLDNIE